MHNPIVWCYCDAKSWPAEGFLWSAEGFAAQTSSQTNRSDQARNTKSDFSRRDSQFSFRSLNSSMFHVFASRFSVESETNFFLMILFNYLMYTSSEQVKKNQFSLKKLTFCCGELFPSGFFLRIPEATAFTNKKMLLLNFQFPALLLLSSQPSSNRWEKRLLTKLRKSVAVLPQISTGSRRMPN